MTVGDEGERLGALAQLHRELKASVTESIGQSEKQKALRAKIRELQATVKR